MPSVALVHLPLTGGREVSLRQVLNLARNATTEWIAYLGPDDTPSPDWLSLVTTAAERYPKDVAVVATRVLLRESGGARRDSHELRARFARGSRLIDTRREADFLVPDLTGIVLKVSAVNALTVRPDSESSLIAALLEYFPRAAVLTEAEMLSSSPAYVRDSTSPLHDILAAYSTSRSSHSITGATTTLFLLRQIYMRELSVLTKSVHLTKEEQHSLLDITQLVLLRIPADRILSYSATSLRADLRLLFLALRGEDVPAIGHTTVRGPVRKTEFRYLHVGQEVDEQFVSAGRLLTPETAKWRRLDFFGQSLLRERVLWLPTVDKFSAVVGGRQLRIGHRTYPPVADHPPALDQSAPVTNAPQRKHGMLTHWSRAALKMLRREGTTPATSSPRVPAATDSRYKDSWLLMDRVDRAGDSAEVLFRHLRRQRPDINAWFVIDTDSADSKRLCTDDSRIIGYGSEEHISALQQAKIVASSFVDSEMTHPVPDSLYPRGVRPWRFVYLQHGVLHNDLSLWFNSKPIDLMITATRSEYDAIIRDDSSYLLTSQTVKLTGFPRHDELLRHRAADTSSPNLVLLAPTWRMNLMGPKGPSGRRHLDPAFATTVFAREWLGLAADLELQEIARAHRCRVALLLHPNMRGQVPTHLLPDDVKVVGDDTNTNALLCGSRVLITDYSSIAFDAAIVGSDIAYFQFDRNLALAGDHTYLQGDFDYERDGLGPVATSRGELLSTLEVLLEHVGHDSQYNARHEAIREYADGFATGRVIEAIQQLLA